ncbi:MAG: hypothetical protein ABH828_02760 [archaeon]
MKKGQFRELGAIVLIVITFFIIYLLVKNISGGLGNSTRGADCLAGITLKTQTTFEKMSGFVNYGGIDSSCPRYIVTITPKKTNISRSGKEIDTQKYEVLTDEVVNGIVSDELVNCWYQFGAGKVDAFWVPENFFKSIVSDKDVKGCRVCSEIRFDLGVGDSDKPLDVQFDGFYDYLQDYDINKKRITGASINGSIYHYIAESERYCNGEHTGKGLGTNCWERYADLNKIATEGFYFDIASSYYVVLVRQGIKQHSGTINAYVLSKDDYEKSNICESGLPFQ